MWESWEFFGEEDEEENLGTTGDAANAPDEHNDVEQMNVDAGGEEPGEPDPPGV